MMRRPGSAASAAASSGAGVRGAEIDVVHELQERVRVDLVQLDEAGQRRAVVVVVALLQVAGMLQRQIEVLGDEGAHALVDLGEQVAGRRVERVVEIEHPHAGIVEAAPRRRRLHDLEA